MGMKKVMLAAALAAALGGGTAVAGDYGNYGGDTYYIEAPVVDVEPMVRHVRVSEPREVCRDQQVHRVERGHGRNGPTGAIVGAIVGGAIGNNVADGDDRQTARLAGAVLGGTLGYNVSKKRGHDRRMVTNERRCDVEHVSRTEERVSGYRVTYLYEGRERVIQRDRHPGDTIRLRVSVQPTH